MFKVIPNTDFSRCSDKEPLAKQPEDIGSDVCFNYINILTAGSFSKTRLSFRLCCLASHLCVCTRLPVVRGDSSAGKLRYSKVSCVSLILTQGDQMSSGFCYIFMKTGLLTIENRIYNIQRDRSKQALISVFPPLHFYYFLRNICHALSF